MRALAGCLKHQADCEAELQQLQITVQSSNGDLRAHLTGVLDMSFLAAHRRFMVSMQRHAVAVVQRIAAAQQRVTDARAALAEAAKQRKVLEKLRERQYQRWRNDLAARELRDLDEVGMQLSFQNLATATAGQTLAAHRHRAGDDGGGEL
jgi:flagellar protein FliJ